MFPNATGTGNKDTLANDPALRLHATQLQHAAPSAPTGTFTFHFADHTIDDLWMAIAWGT